jgi:hypothetical protein
MQAKSGWAPGPGIRIIDAERVDDHWLISAVGQVAPACGALRAHSDDTEAKLAALLPGLLVTALGGRLHPRPASVPRNQNPRLHWQFLPSGAPAGDVAIYPTQCAGTAGRHSGSRYRPCDGLADLSDHCCIALYEAASITDARAGALVQIAGGDRLRWRAGRAEGREWVS